MKYIWILALILVSGCTPKLQDIMPADIASFDLIEYHRGGGFSSATIIAKDGIKVGDAFEIGELNIVGDYPFFNVNIKVLNYTQENQ